MINCSLVDNITGEIYNDNYNVDTLKDMQRRKYFKERKLLNDEFKDVQSQYLGNFVFFIYKHMDKLEDVLNGNDLVKFMYLGTYVRPDGFLKLDNNTTLLKKRDIKGILKITDRKTFDNFYNKLLKEDLIKEKDGGISISLEYFYRGKERDYVGLTNNRLNRDFTRIYINTTRKLYEGTSPRQQKFLAIIYKLLPYVNLKLNVVCKNPKEENRDLIKPYSILEISELLGYNKENQTRFKNDFGNLTYNGSPIFGMFNTYFKRNKTIIFVNPQVYYAGNKTEDLSSLITMFNLSKDL